jgi:hypothetical protein
MPEELTTTSLKTLLKFPFKEQDWKSRFFIGILLYLARFIPIVGLAAGLLLQGYFIRMMRRASKGEELTMPAWDDWGEMLKDGLQGLVIQMAYILPGVLVYVGGILVYFIASLSLPLLFSAPRAGSEGSPSAALLIILFFAIMAILFLTMLLAIALMILGAIPLPVALAHFSAKGDLSAAFRVKEWWPLLRANRLGYFIAWVIIIGLISMLYSVLVPIYSALYFTLFLMPFLMIASFILLAPLYLYLSMIVAALYGRTYWESAALAEGQAGEA